MRSARKRNRKIKILPGAALYVILLAFSVVLTQLLRNGISSGLFLFLIALPIVSIVHCLIGRSAIQAFVTSEKPLVEKGERVEYEIRIVNTSFLSFPFVETVISEPGAEGARCTRKKVVLSLVPFGYYSVKDSVAFKYRGSYEIGVESLYISDMFRFFAIRAEMDNYAAVGVSPRRMTLLGAGERSITDVPSSRTRRDTANERGEISDIRDYVPGDPIRDVHWKLSSKTQDLMVKQYNNSENRHVYIFCDLAGAAEPPKKRDYSDIYDDLKSHSEEEERRAVKKKLRRAISDRAAKGEDEAQGNDRKKRLGAFAAKIKSILPKNKKNDEEAGDGSDDASAINELIKTTRKPKSDRDKKEKTEDGDTKQMSVSEVESDLARIFDTFEPADSAPRRDGDAAFGGRVREDEAAEFDEYCADAVVEMTLAECAADMRRGNACTVVWSDVRSDHGVTSVTVTGEPEFELLVSRLARAGVAPSGEYVSHLMPAVAESSDVTLKVVTSNIDPVSAADIASLPARFGGAGTGCRAEAVIHSPIQKYEDPTLRSVYTSQVTADLARCGFTAYMLSESTDGAGRPVFVVSR